MNETRLTVGRVKPYFDLHKLCACDVIMIPERGWIWTPPLDWTPLVYSIRYMGLGMEYLNLGHLIDTLRYLATPLLKFSVDQ